MDGRDRPRAHAPPTDVVSTPRPRKEYERAQSGIKKRGKARALRPAPAPPPSASLTSICLFIYLLHRISVAASPRPPLGLDCHRGPLLLLASSSSSPVPSSRVRGAPVSSSRRSSSTSPAGTGAARRRGRGFAPRGLLHPPPPTAWHARLSALSTLF